MSEDLDTVCTIIMAAVYGWTQWQIIKTLGFYYLDNILSYVSSAHTHLTAQLHKLKDVYIVFQRASGTQLCSIPHESLGFCSCVYLFVTVTLTQRHTHTSELHTVPYM